MFHKIVSLTFILLLPFTFARVTGQHNNTDGLRVLIPPQTEDICTLEPTDHNAHFFISPATELLHQMEKQEDYFSSAFEVDYRVMNGSSCGASAWPQDARNAFEYAMSIWSFHLHSDVPIRVDAVWREIDSPEGSTTLGSAGPTRIVQDTRVGIPDTWYAIAQMSAMSGRAIRDQIEDLDHDIIININCDFDEWYFGTDASTPGNRTDFVTVVLHEIGHGIGFIGSATADNDVLIGEWGTPLPGEFIPHPFIFDHFVFDGDESNILNENVYPNPSLNLYNALTGQNGRLYFDGEETNITLEEEQASRAWLYTPLPYREGSSYSHLDDDTFRNTPNALMRPRIDRSMAVHTPGPLFCGMLNDMGWPLSAGCLTFIADDAAIAFSEPQINFRVTNIDRDIQRMLTISNRNDAEETLFGFIEAPDESFTVSEDQSFTLEPGQSTTFTIQYNPEEAGRHSGELRIVHNANNLPSPFIIPVMGEALDSGMIVNLEQSYPNPIVPNNPNPTIPYAISQDSNVALDLYTITGQHVGSLINEQQNSGRYEVEVDIRGLSSGVYIYRIIVGQSVKSGKLMLAN